MAYSRLVVLSHNIWTIWINWIRWYSWDSKILQYKSPITFFYTNEWLLSLKNETNVDKSSLVICWMYKKRTLETKTLRLYIRPPCILIKSVPPTLQLHSVVCLLYAIWLGRGLVNYIRFLFISKLIVQQCAQSHLMYNASNPWNWDLVLLENYFFMRNVV